MVKVKEILNPLILNDGWVGFNGDSEFIDSTGTLQMGSWTFHGFIEDAPCNNESEVAENFRFDDDIDEELLYLDKVIFQIENDNGKVCGIQFHYQKGDDEDGRFQIW